MSAFLGPIHYWLYNKIKHQQSIVDEIYTLGNPTSLPLQEDAEKLYGRFENKPLEEIIDQSNIHGWLQEQVSQVEYKYAYVVTRLLQDNQANLSKLKSILKTHGREEGEKLAETNPTAVDLYKLISDCLLDGMPCDRVNTLLDKSDSLVTWKRNLCVHESYWEEVGGDINIYYQLRDAWIEGLTSEYGFTFTKTDSDLYHIEEDMDSIKLMMEEHKNILRMITVIRKACYSLLNGGEINYHDFNNMIDFIRSYADHHHHGKEEKFLFNQMVQHLGSAGNKLITHGMLVEHDHGRLLIRELDEALQRVKDGDEESKLDVISNAVGYGNYLSRHIDKEDSVVYTLAERELSEDIIDAINQKTKDFENSSEGEYNRNKYIEMLNSLEEKYL